MTPDDLMRMMQGIQTASILKAGIELGVFEALAEGPAGPARVSKAISADERGTRLLLLALAALGLVDKDGDAFALTPVADQFLVPGRPVYLGGAGRIFMSDHITEGFLRVPDAVRHGGTVLDIHAETPEHPFWEDFAQWSESLAMPAALAIAGHLAGILREKDHIEVLDIACGSGLYGYTLARGKPHVRVTSQDWSNVLDHTRANAEKLGVTDQVRYLEGDVFAIDLGGPYDIIVMSHIFHHFSPDRCQELLNRIAAVTRAGGWVVIHDFIPEGRSPTEEVFEHIFSVLMLIWTKQGEAYGLENYRGWLDAAGFGPPAVHPVGVSPGTVLIAQKT